MSARPIHKVFEQRAQRIGLVLSTRLDRFKNWNPHGHEPLNPIVHDDHNGILLQYQRVSDAGCWIEFGSVQAAGTAHTVYGAETILNAVDLGAVEETISNLHGLAPIDVSFRDLFASTDTKETEKSGGTSTKIHIEAEEGIEGFGSIKESIEQEVHAEFSERSSSETTNEREGHESTTVPVGSRVRILETRRRVDSEVTVTSDGAFTFNLRAGGHDHRWNHGWKKGRPWHHSEWSSWQDFVDLVNGDAPSNTDLYTSFLHHHVPHAWKNVLDPLNSRVRYKVRFEGKIIKTYTVEPI